MTCRHNYCFSLGRGIGDSVYTRRVVSSFLFALALVLVTVSLPTYVYGGPFSYPDLFGTDVDYINISENSVTDAVPLFGAPTVNGNQIEFTPTAAFAASTSGGGFKLVDGQLNFEVCAHDGKVIDNFMLSESGFFTLSGTGTSATAVSVSTPTLITITEVDGAALVPSVQIATNMDFLPAGNAPTPFGNYNLTTHAATGTPWSGLLSADITQKLIDENIDFDFGATKIEVVLDNILTATSQTGSTAEISKGEFTDIIILTNIPEPTSIGLAFVSLLAMAMARRRIS